MFVLKAQGRVGTERWAQRTTTRCLSSPRSSPLCKHWDLIVDSVELFSSTQPGSPSRQAAHTAPLHPDAKAPAAAPVPGIALTAAGKALCPEATGQQAEGEGHGPHWDHLNPYLYVGDPNEVKVRQPAETRTYLMVMWGPQCRRDKDGPSVGQKRNGDRL